MDTHVFLWFALSDRRLPKDLRLQIESHPEEVLVPSICLWEALLLHERGRLAINTPNPALWLRQSVRQCSFQEADLTFEMVLLSRTLSFAHQDPADRFIAATSYSLNEPLATFDQELRKLPWLTVWN